MIILKILFWFIVLYLSLFAITCIVTYTRGIYISYFDRKKDIEKGVIKKPNKKEKKEYNKVWNSSLGVWEIEN